MKAAKKDNLSPSSVDEELLSYQFLFYHQRTFTAMQIILARVGVPQAQGLLLVHVQGLLLAMLCYMWWGLNQYWL